MHAVLCCTLDGRIGTVDFMSSDITKYFRVLPCPGGKATRAYVCVVGYLIKHTGPF
jgi:hypothetical protein